MITLSPAPGPGGDQMVNDWIPRLRIVADLGTCRNKGPQRDHGSLSGATKRALHNVVA